MLRTTLLISVVSIAATVLAYLRGAFTEGVPVGLLFAIFGLLSMGQGVRGFMRLWDEKQLMWALLFVPAIFVYAIATYWAAGATMSFVH
jgi:sterol desaturase/sphingolipid hydroxylase (fatty acid hydroxylase superfamily)